MSILKSKLSCALLVFLSMSGAVQAQLAPKGPADIPGSAATPSIPALHQSGGSTPGASVSVAAELQRINENMTVLQAQLSQLELKAKIASKQKELNSQSGTDVLSSFGTKGGNPSVVSVAGLQGNLYAVLVFPGGAMQRVKAGDLIDERRVAKVAINEVVLTDLKGRSPQRLGFGATATVREPAVQPMQVGGAIPIMPGSVAAVPMVR